MTNLTSEQYRDIIKNLPCCTEEVPNVQNLLRQAVETFFNRFGAYPEIGGVAPGKIGIFGEQNQFSDGMALLAATPMATIIVGRKAPGEKFAVATSADVGKPHKVKFSFSRNRPLAPGCPTWLNRIKGVIENYTEAVVPPFEAAIESSIPMGVGMGSSAAVEVSVYSFLEVLTGRKSEPLTKAQACQKAGKFAGGQPGIVDRMTSVVAKDRHAVLIDCNSNEVDWMPFRNPTIAFVAVDTHLKDKLLGKEYVERTKYLKKACEILGLKTLRNCTEDDLLELENRVNDILNSHEEEEEEEEEEDEEDEEENRMSTISGEGDKFTKEDYDKMMKRVRFYVTETKRIEEAMQAWKDNNIEDFGEKMKESHKSLKEDFGFENPVLDFLVETSLEVNGVLGSKMIGMGLDFGGGIISMMNKTNVEEYCGYLIQKFEESKAALSENLKNTIMEEKRRQKELDTSEASTPSTESVQDGPECTECGEIPKRRFSKKPVIKEQLSCTSRKNQPCIVKVEKKDCKDTKPCDDRKKPCNTETKPAPSGVIPPSQTSVVSEISDIELNKPTFYLVSPFAGARMMFVTRTDILRSRYASPMPHPKTLIRGAVEEFKTSHSNSKVEAVGLAPASLTLFGEFMEYHLGNIICMALPLYTVILGGRNDSVWFSFKTLSKEVEEPREIRYPVPCVREPEIETRTWANYIVGTVKEFKGHVPGFDAVVNSSVPIQVGVNSCAALQAAVYTFLEHLARDCTTDLFEKAERCGRSESEFDPNPTELVTRCSSIKFYPTIFGKEGHLMFINCKRPHITQHFFDHPSYVFLIACCKENTSDITLVSLEERLEQCKEALDILGRDSLLNADLKHLRCLKKRGASEVMIKRVKYVITEHQRTLEAVKAIKDEDYARIGVLMNHSHESLRDDYEVSSPEIEKLIELALSVEEVLGAKMLGKGLNATILILTRIIDAEKCIRYMRKNYAPKRDRPVFYITKPSQGAFMMSPEDIFQIP